MGKGAVKLSITHIFDVVLVNAPSTGKGLLVAAGQFLFVAGGNSWFLASLKDS